MSHSEIALALKKTQQREEIAYQVRHKQERLALEGKQLIYQNQKEAATEIVDALINKGYSHVCLVAQPGTGKTGTALEVMIQLGTHISDEHLVELDKIYITCGMSDRDWEEQFRKNLPSCFLSNVDHRGNLLKNAGKISEFENGILINDECHIASGKNMTGSKVMREAGLTDYATIRERNMKMLDISATPDSVLHDLQSPEWIGKSYVVRLMPGPSYKGFQTMIDDNRIFHAQPLDTRDKVMELLTIWGSRFGRVYKYFVIRKSKNINMEYLNNAVTLLGWELIHHDSIDRIEGIDERMTLSPFRNTIIYVKEFWRASKRINRRHVGGTYESIPKCENITSTAQSLVARFCDNYEYTGDELDVNMRPLHYTDKDAIQHYLNWFNNGCAFERSDYTSTRIKSRSGNVIAKPSKVHPSNMQNLLNPGQVIIQRGKRRVPIVFGIPDNINHNDFMGTTLSPEQKTSIIRQLVAEKEYSDEFKKVISEIQPFQITAPESEASYKKNIRATVNAFNDNKKIGIGQKPARLAEDVDNKTSWQCFIDIRDRQMCILWQVVV
jgi:hypothetical protein